MQTQRTNSTTAQRNKRTPANLRPHKQRAPYSFEGYQRPASSTISSKRSQQNRTQTALALPKPTTNANRSAQLSRLSTIGVTSASIKLRQKRNKSDGTASLAAANTNNQTISIDDSSQEADGVFPDVDDILGTPSKATNDRRPARPSLKRTERSLNVISSEGEESEPPVERRSRSPRHNSKRNRRHSDSSQSDEVKLISDIQLSFTPKPAPLETATTLRSPPATLPRAKEKATVRQSSALFSTQDTLIGTSLGSHNNTATRMGSIGDLSLTPCQTKRKLSVEPSVEPPVPQGVDAELPDVPIGEFFSQKPSPPTTTSISKKSQGKKRQPTLVSSDPIEPSTGEPGQQDSSISQWYNDCHDTYIGAKDDSQIGGSDRQSPQRRDEEPHATMFPDSIDHGFHQESQLDSQSMPSSPLEGFCDVRNMATANSGNTAIYMDQFMYGNSKTSRQDTRTPTTTTVQRDNSGGGIRPAGSKEMFQSLAKRHSPSSLSKDSTVHTNHYADEGSLDIAPSMNWEGQGGSSRFG